MGEHLPCKQGVRSSNLLISTKTIENCQKNHDNYKIKEIKKRLVKSNFKRKKEKTNHWKN